MGWIAIGERLAALSGIAFVVLLVASLLVSDPNRDAQQTVSPEQASTVLARTMAEHREETALGAYLGLLSIFSLLWFVAYLQRQLRRAEGDGGWLASVAYGGGLVFAGVMTAAVGYQIAMGVLGDYGRDPVVAKTLVVLTWDHLAVTAAPVAALVGGASGVALRYGALPRWLGWFGVPVMLVLLSPTFVAGQVGYLAGLFGFFLWIIATSVVLVRSVGRPEPGQIR